MSVRTDASGDYLRRTANLPTSTAFTIAGWCNLASIRASAYQYSALENSATSASGYLALGFTDAGAFGIASSNGTTIVNFASQPTAGNWFFWALVGSGSGAGGLTGYWGGLTTNPLVTTSTNGASFTTAALTIGNDSYDEWMNATWAATKVWDAALTATELEQERWTYRPQRFANLNVWSPNFPGATERLADYSGNGRNWTAGGTLTDEDGPPVSWGAPVWIVGKPVAAGGAFSIDAAQGSYALTGQAAGLVTARTVDAAQGTYTQTGQAAGLFRGYPMVAAQGSYTLTGQAAGLTATRLLDAAQGSYTLAGQTASLFIGRMVAAAQGSYSLSGQDAALLAARRLAADQGSYALTGQDAAFLVNRLLAAAQGAYTLTGINADLIYTPIGGYSLTADVGSFTLSGQAAALLASRIMALDAGAYVLSGQDAALLFNRLIAANQGSYTLTGQDAAFLVSRLIAADAGSYVLSGQAVTLVWSGEEIPVTPNDRIYVIPGEDRVFVIVLEGRALAIPAEDRVYAI